MKMFIPKLGTKLILTDPWSFSLLCEQRNKTLWNLKTERAHMDMIPLVHRKGQAAVVFLTPGDILTVDRVHIRKGADAYDSVTMRGTVQHEGHDHKVRFWVMLHDFNTMHAEVLPDA